MCVCVCEKMESDVGIQLHCHNSMQPRMFAILAGQITFSRQLHTPVRTKCVEMHHIKLPIGKFGFLLHSMDV